MVMYLASVPLGQFLDLGGDPCDRMPADRLEPLVTLVASAWNPVHGQLYRDRLRQQALRQQLSLANTSVERDNAQIAALWTADLLRDRRLFDQFTAQIAARANPEPVATPRTPSGRRDGSAASLDLPSIGAP